MTGRFLFVVVTCGILQLQLLPSASASFSVHSFRATSIPQFRGQSPCLPTSSTTTIGLLSWKQGDKSNLQFPILDGPLNHACCVKYTTKPLDFSLIKGYIEQSSREVCRINAIIFFTKHDKKVCASAEDKWVKKILFRLSVKMKRMSKPQRGRIPLLSRANQARVVPTKNSTLNFDFTFTTPF